MEEWRDIQGYEGLYLISSYGNAKSLYTGKLLTRRINPVSGYTQYCLCRDGTKEYLYAHRLVAMAFIPNTENKATVNHKDENRHNNQVNNLEWATYSENNTYNNAHLRRVENTDVQRRTAKTDFKAIAQKNKKPIYQCDKRGKIIKKWDGTVDAAAALGISKATIWTSLNNFNRTAGGNRWMYA